MSQLVKATLVSLDGVPPIQFMFNPTELTFDGNLKTSDNPGARSQKSGKPKVSFSHVEAGTLTIKNIIFDTYERGIDVTKTYILPFKGAIQFAPGKERPPIYTFAWGSQIYMRRCFLEKLNYRLTMFLPNGTPVRAVIDSLLLKEADEEKPSGGVGAASSNSSGGGASLFSK